MQNRSAHWITLIIILVGFAMMSVRSFQIPMWIGYHHERDTFLAARITAENKRLPIPSDYPDGQFEIQQGSQPPLHAVAAALIVGLFDDGMSLTLPENPTPYCIAGEGLYTRYTRDTQYNPPYSGTIRAAYGLRLLSAALVASAAWMTYLAGRVWFPKQPQIAIIAAALLTFDAYHQWIGSRIINDSMLLLVAGVFIYVLGRLIRAEQWRWSHVLWLLVVMALTGMTKLTGWVLIGVGALALVFKLGQRLWQRPTRNPIIAFFAVLLALVILIGGLAFYNQQTTGSVFGRYNNLADIALRLISALPQLPNTIAPVLNFSFNDYLSPLSQAEMAGRWQRLYTRATFALLIIATAGLLRMIFSKKPEQHDALLWLGLIVFGTALLVVLRNHIASLGGTASESLIYAPVRYYAVGSPAFILILSASLWFIWPQRYPIIGIVAASGWFMASLGIIWIDPPANMLHEARIGYQDTPTDNAMPYLYDTAAQVNDGAIRFTLDMTTDTVQNTAWMPQITLSSDDETAVVCQFVPVHGFYPVSGWEAGQIVREEITVHNCQEPLQGDIRARLDWIHPENGDLIMGESLPLEIESLPLSEACPTNLGRINDTLQITNMRLAETIQAGQPFEPYVNYLVLNTPIGIETRTFTLAHTESGTQYQCTGLRNIHGNWLTFGEARAQIPRGNTIYLDSCLIDIPDDAPIGSYTVTVAFEDMDGNTINDGTIELGQLTVTAP